MKQTAMPAGMRGCSDEVESCRCFIGKTSPSAEFLTWIRAAAVPQATNSADHSDPTRSGAVAGKRRKMSAANTAGSSNAAR